MTFRNGCQMMSTIQTLASHSAYSCDLGESSQIFTPLIHGCYTPLDNRMIALHLTFNKDSKNYHFWADFFTCFVMSIISHPKPIQKNVTSQRTQTPFSQFSQVVPYFSILQNTFAMRIYMYTYYINYNSDNTLGGFDHNITLPRLP